MASAKFSTTDLTALDTHLHTNSYVGGWEPTQSDVVLIGKICQPDVSKFPHANRWFRHISSFNEREQTQWAANGEAVGNKAVAKQGGKKPAKDDDDDFDLFGEQTADEKAAITEKKAAAGDAKKEKKEDEKKKKKEVIAKSTLVFEIKPMSSESNLGEIEELLRKLEIEGLEWSQASKKVPLVFGLFKLQIGATIVDALVETESVLEKIETLGLSEEKAKERIARRDQGADDEEEDEDGLVQSVQIISFQKV